MVDAWMQSLEDFEQSTQEFNPDGVPLAIEGIETLACYIEALEPTDDLSAFLASLKGLALANRSYADTDQGVKQFGLWRASAAPIISNLRTLSVHLLQEEASMKEDGRKSGGT